MKYQTTELENTGKISINLEHTQTAKAFKLIEEGKIRKTETGYLVIGSRGLTWDIKDNQCECEGFTFRGYCVVHTLKYVGYGLFFVLSLMR